MTLRTTPPRILLAALAVAALAGCSGPGATEPAMDLSEPPRFSASGDTTTVTVDDGVWGIGSGGVSELQGETAGDSVPSGEMRGVWIGGSGG